MSRYTRLSFYLSQTGGKFHLPFYANADYASCRRDVMLDTGLHDASVSTHVAMIEKNQHSMFICDNCARIAVNMTKEDQS